MSESALRRWVDIAQIISAAATTGALVVAVIAYIWQVRPLVFSEMKISEAQEEKIKAQKVAEAASASAAVAEKRSQAAQEQAARHEQDAQRAKTEIEGLRPQLVALQQEKASQAERLNCYRNTVEREKTRLARILARQSLAILEAACRRHTKPSRRPGTLEEEFRCTSSTNSQCGSGRREALLWSRVELC